MNETPSPDDWRRIGQERYLKGKRLVRQQYREYRPGWDHDHCEFCQMTFSLFADDLKEGYSTEDQYYWICPKCFGEFEKEFEWQLKM